MSLFLIYHLKSLTGRLLGDFHCEILSVYLNKMFY